MKRAKIFPFFCATLLAGFLVMNTQPLKAADSGDQGQYEMQEQQDEAPPNFEPEEGGGNEDQMFQDEEPSGNEEAAPEAAPETEPDYVPEREMKDE